MFFFVFLFCFVGRNSLQFSPRIIAEHTSNACILCTEFIGLGCIQILDTFTAPYLNYGVFLLSGWRKMATLIRWKPFSPAILDQSQTSPYWPRTPVIIRCRKTLIVSLWLRSVLAICLDSLPPAQLSPAEPASYKVVWICQEMLHAVAGRKRLLEFCLDKGYCTLDSFDQYKRTPLLRAVEGNRLEIVQ